MNFELKTLDLAGAVALKCDALAVLVTANFKPGTDALSLLVAQALKADDLQSKPGKLLSLYRPVGVQCVRDRKSVV